MRGSLIVVACLEENDTIVLHKIDNTMFLIETARPCAWRKILKRLGLTYASMRITKNSLNQFENAYS